MTKLFLWIFTISFCSIPDICLGNNSVVWTKNPSAGIKKIRTVKTRLLFGTEFFIAGKPNLSGIGFPPGAQTLLMLNKPTGANLVLVAPPLHKKDKVSRISIEIPDPINIAFDTMSQGAKGFSLSRLFLLDAKLGQLIAIKAAGRDVMDSTKIRRVNLKKLAISDPQGMTIDPSNGRLYILDGVDPRLLILDPKSGREFENATITRIDLPDNLGTLRGLAFNPSDRHLYMTSPQRQKLYEFTLDGKPVSIIDISDQAFGQPQAMIFAPSLDSTDIASTYHLYVVTDANPSGELNEWALPESF
ncbi:MAG: hypothetical protein ACU83U_09735 [Gammaproteobacteria bacterium]